MFVTLSQIISPAGPQHSLLSDQSSSRFWVVGGIGPNSCWGSPRRASHPSGTLPGNFATLTAGCEALLAALRRGPAGFCVHTTAGQSVNAADAGALVPWQAPLIGLGRTVAQAQALASP